MKNFLFFLLLIMYSCTNSQNVQDFNKLDWIDFEWVGDTIGDKYFDKLYIEIPFSMEGVPHEFLSQFDLGSPSTMVYGNALSPYLNAYPEVAAKLDTIQKTKWMQGQKVGGFESINFKLDNILFENQELMYFDGYGDTMTADSVHTKSKKHIGTIGADLFQNKFLVIDFPNQRIAKADTLSSFYKTSSTFVDAKLDKGRIKVPVNIEGKTHYFMFDTGSSLLPLAVVQDDIKLISNNKMPKDTLNISTWGEFYDIHGYEITSKVSIGDHLINTKELKVYNSKSEFKQFFDEEQILGIMGNAFFLQSVIIIDYQNKRFGVVK